jgi:hypothetical protein
MEGKAADREELTEECGSPLRIAPAPWRYMELSFLSTEKFAAAATGLAFTNLTALSIVAKLSSVLDTLATQEHGERKCSPEIAAFYCFWDPPLAVLIHPDFVADTAYFLRKSIFIAAPLMLVDNLMKFARSQRNTARCGQLRRRCSDAATLPLPFETTDCPA